MASYGNFRLTDSGRNLLASVRDGGGGMEFRFLAVGSGVYSHEEANNIRSSAGLKNECQRVPFASIACKNNGSVTLKACMSNSELTEGYSMTEVGIYAGLKGSEEDILYCITLADNPDYMPECLQGKPFDVIFNVEVGIDDVDKVSISYDVKTYALAEDLNAEMLRAETAEEQLKKQTEIEAERASKKEAELEEKKLDIDGDASSTIVNFLPAEQLEPLQSGGEQRKLFGQLEKAVAELISHLADKANPHDTTKEQVGLGNVDNTSDMAKPVSTAQQAALDALYEQLTAYTLQKIADLINGAPATLDTLGEIAQAMKDNETVVAALDAAIGKKANSAEFDSHVKDATAHVTAAERNNWNRKADLADITQCLQLVGGIMKGTIITTNIEPAANKRYEVGSSSKKYSHIWAETLNAEAIQSPSGTDLTLHSYGGIGLNPDVGDYMRVWVENIYDESGNVNGALYGVGSGYEEYKETWLGTPDHHWDNIFVDKINSKTIPTFRLDEASKTLYIDF